MGGCWGEPLDTPPTRLCTQLMHFVLPPLPHHGHLRALLLPDTPISHTEHLGVRRTLCLVFSRWFLHA